MTLRGDGGGTERERNRGMAEGKVRSGSKVGKARLQPQHVLWNPERVQQKKRPEKAGSNCY